MTYFERLQVRGVVFGLSEETGALVVYQPPSQRGRTVDANLKNERGGTAQKFHANTVERTIDDKEVFAAIFPRLPTGTYDVVGYGDIVRGLTIFPGEVAEIDWR
jgi:hypothetical protein